MQKISVVRIFMTLALILSSLNLAAKDTEIAEKEGKDKGVSQVHKR